MYSCGSYLETKIQKKGCGETNADNKRAKHVVEILATALPYQSCSLLVHIPAPYRRKDGKGSVDNSQSLGNNIVDAGGVV